MQKDVGKHWLRFFRISKHDFKGIFKAMAGCPVTVRLLDPPLHEFVPHDLKGQQEMADSNGCIACNISSNV